MFDFGYTKADDHFVKRIEKVTLVAVSILIIWLVAYTAYKIQIHNQNKILLSVPNPKTKPVLIPQQVVVNHQSWRLQLADDLGEEVYKGHHSRVYGETDCLAHSIFLWQGQSTETMKNTIFHELAHAGVCIFDTKQGWTPDNGIYNQSPKEADSHPAIYAFSDVMEPILQDNPELDAYFASPVPDPKSTVVSIKK